MEVLKVIKTDRGRVTIQKNSFGIYELKVRVDGKTNKLLCYYGKQSEIENIVDGLLNSNIN